MQPAAGGTRHTVRSLGADPWTAAHHRFAAVFADEDHQLLYVELDGCYRIMTADGNLRQGTKGLADLLSAAL